MCFIKTANIAVYLNTAEYENSGPVWLKEIKMLRIHFFSIFTMKTTRALDALTPLGLLIVKTLTLQLLRTATKTQTMHGFQ